MKVGIVGAGLQAKRRAPVVLESKNCELISITSDPPEAAESLARKLDCDVLPNWVSVLDSGIDAVMVLTPPNLHAKISIEAMKRGIHVLCEKPIANTLEDAKEMIKISEERKVILKIGFNHRYHPAIKQIKKWYDNWELGRINFIRSIYGIGARPDVKNEWRSDPKTAAGGQLFEQGIHSIDLMRWFIGEPSEVVCLTSGVNSIISPLEDNAFVTFRNQKGQITNIHSSILQWKNHFSFEVFGTEGYAIANGLGGSYGVEKAILGRRDPVAPFSENIIEYRGEDKSWLLEWQDFEDSINKGYQPFGSGKDGYEAIRLVFAAYQSQKENKIVRLD